MGQAYTPGLKIQQRALIRKERLLPLEGDVLVHVGEKVKADTSVARTLLRGHVELLNVANQLGVDAKEIKECMRKQEGALVNAGELLASHSGLFGLFKSESRSSLTGSIENISTVTGKVMVREKPIPLEVKAYVEGEVESVIPERGVTLRTWGAYAQGIFGFGGETWGELQFAVSDTEQVLDESLLSETHEGKIVVGGNRVTRAALAKGVKLGVKGVIAGGIDDQELKEFLGYDLGVAVTGTETLGITLIITEGFGAIQMSRKMFELLKTCEGRLTSINGATQIRAGVIRPEIIIPFIEEGNPHDQKREDAEVTGLQVGSLVRIIREPHFGSLAKVLELPPSLTPLETEAHVRVAKVLLADGVTEWTFPRSNLELV